MDLQVENLRSTDFADITRVLEAKNPARPLLLDVTGAAKVSSRSTAGESERDVGHDNDEDRDLGFAIVKAGMLIQIKPLDGSPDQEIWSFVLQQDDRFRVMRNDEESEWVDIIAPYYGHCLVARESIDHVNQAPNSESSMVAGYHGAITSLAFHGDEWKTLFPLAEFVGPKLLKVVVDNCEVLDILSSCPNLTDLTIRHTDESLKRDLIRAYGSGRCKIERLCIDGFHGGYEDPPTDFIRLLEDPTTHIAETLRRLKLTGRELNIGTCDFDAYARMLQVNRTLEYLRFTVSSGYFCPRHQLMKTNGVMLSTPRPLCQPSRIAFLSVVRHFSSSMATVVDEEPPRKRHRSTPQHQ